MTWEAWSKEVNRRARSSGWAFKDEFTDAHQSECITYWRTGKRPDYVFESKEGQSDG